MVNKKLYRIEKGKMLFGVCGGVAEYFNVDPSLIRIGWVLFGLFAGTGLLAYIFAAIILPVKTN
ncbi:MAG: PspC domain-containing protein [Bacilli bacterium]|nr:PspC domain-containing protein [Bacilli bacterium]